MTTEAKTSDLLHRIFEIRTERAALEAKDKELREEFSMLEQVLLARADEQGATRISTSDGTAIVSEEELPQVDDWDIFHGWIKDNDAFYMLQRRVASAAYREAIKSGQTIPGISTYVKRGLNFRAAK